jgi:hypothetical protein
MSKHQTCDDNEDERIDPATSSARAAGRAASRSHAELVASFLENACLHYGVNPASGAALSPR